MTEQNPLSDPAHPPYQPGSATSRAAAADVTPRFAGHARSIMRFLYLWRNVGPERRGGTQAEMSALLHISRQSITGPVSRLEEAGFIRKAPELPDRVNRETGSKCGVYVITKEGVKAWQEDSIGSRSSAI